MTQKTRPSSSPPSAKLPTKHRVLFQPGRIVGTPGALEALQRASYPAQRLVWRHITGQWDTLPPEDREANRAAVRLGERVISAFTLATEETVWVITEYDRTITTILLPSEY